jgi:PAS domain S-box-containing protein
MTTERRKEKSQQPQVQVEMQRLALVNEIARQIASVLELEKLLPEAASAIQRRFPAYNVCIFLSDHERGELELWASSGYLEGIVYLHHRQAIGRGLVGHAVAEGQTILANDAAQDPRYIRAFKETEPVAGSELCVPLRLGGRVLGVLDFQSLERNAFQMEDVTTFETLADQLVVAIDNARFFTQEQEQHRLAETLREVGIAINSALDLDVVLQLILEQVERVVPYDSANVMLLEGHRVRVASMRGYERFGAAEEVKNVRWDVRDVANLRLMSERHQAQVVPDTMNDPAWIRTEFSEHIGSWVGSPLVAHDEVIGFFCLDKTEPNFYDEAHAAALDAFAPQAAVAITNARLHAQTLEGMRELTAILRVNQTLSGTTLDLDEILDVVIEEAVTLAGCDEGFIALRDFSDDTLHIVASRGIDDANIAVAKIQPIKANRGTLAVSVLRGEIVEIADTSQSSLPENFLYREMPRSLSSIPLKIGERVTGVISLATVPPNEQARRLLRAMADVAAVAIERARLFESVQRSQGLYRTLFDGVPEAVLLFDPESLRILDVNETCVARYGYTRQELLEMTVCDLLPSKDVEHCQAIAQETLVRKSYRHPSDVQHLCRDGSLLDVSIHSTIIRLSGRPAILTIASDVTRRRKLEEQLRLAQKMESVGLLASGVAHDFNNILTTILGNASLLRAQLDTDSPLAADLKTIEGSARRGADLTRRLLTFARVGRQQTALVNINELAREVTTILSHTLDKRITIQQQLDEQIASVRGDASQLQQVLMNLVINARDAMPDGGRLMIKTRDVVLSEERTSRYLDIAPGRYTQLTVEDTGIGMDAEVKSRIFEPFFTTKEPGKGTGLGLAMVFSIVKDHAGHIDVYSEPGQGTQVRVFLPAAEEGVPTAKEKPAPEPVGGTETILIVDDEEPILEMTTRLLTEYGYKVLTASSGEEGLEIYDDHKEEIALVILDLIMPGMGGRETWRRLREMSPRCKVLLASGLWLEDVAREALTTGVTGFIQKPYETSGLLEQIRQVLDSL